MTAVPWHGQSQIVGRASELIEIEALLHALAFDQGRTLTIGGEAGIGKTRLAQEIARGANQLGYTVLWGRGAEFQDDVPFALLADVFSGPQLERYEYRAVRSLLENTAQSSPLVLVFDDVHWGDRPSLELIGRLLRDRPGGPILLVVTYRWGPPSGTLSRVLGAAARNRELTALELSPLSLDEAAHLCEEFDGADRAALYRQSGGNPFYLEQLLLHVRRAGLRRLAHPAPSRSGASAVPPMVRLAIADELRAMSCRAKSILRAGAAVGGPLQVKQVAEVATITLPQAQAAIDELIARDLLCADGARDRARFRHPVVRDAVYESTDAPARQEMHARAAAMLERHGAPPVAVAHHLERSARVGDETAIARLVNAAEHDAPRAPLVAARWYRAALRLLPADADLSRRIGLIAKLADTLASGGRADEAGDALRLALELVPSTPQASHAAVVASVARVANMIGQGHEVRDRVQRALASVEDERLACELELALALDDWRSYDLGEMANHTASAHHRAHVLDDDVLVLRAAASLAVAELERGAVVASSLAADDARASFAKVSDADIAARLEALVLLGLAEALLERRRAAIEDLERALSIAQGTGQSYFEVILATILGMAQLYLGELAGASETLERAVEASGLVTDDGSLIWTRALRCWASTLRGCATDGLWTARDEIQGAGRERTAPSARWGRCFYGRALIEAGDPGVGRAWILEGAGGPELPLLPPSTRGEWYASLTDAELALGLLDAADDTATRAEASAAALPTAAATACAQLARATVAFARGGFEPARDLALSAAVSFDAGGQLIDAGRARTLAARALAALGHTEPAVELLTQASAALDSAGAIRYHDDASRELRRLGVAEADPDPDSARAGGTALREAVELRPVVCDRRAYPVASRLDAELFQLTFGGKLLAPQPDAPPEDPSPTPPRNLRVPAPPRRSARQRE